MAYKKRDAIFPENLFVVISSILCFLLLSACGGGGGSDIAMDTGGVQQSGPVYSVTTLASDTCMGPEDKNAPTALKQPQGLALGPNGSLYVSDTGNRKICKISADGKVSHIAGSYYNIGGFYTCTQKNYANQIDGSCSVAKFGAAKGIAIGNDGSIYVADHDFNLIRKIINPGTSACQVISVAGCSGELNWPTDVAVDSENNLFVTNTGPGTIVKFTPSGLSTVLAGAGLHLGNVDGKGSLAQFFWPYGITIDRGNLLVSDVNNQNIRKITADGTVTTVAGKGIAGNTDGLGKDALFNWPEGLSVDNNDTLFVADMNNNAIRTITSAGQVTTLAVHGLITHPENAVIDSSGNIYITNDNKISKLAPE